MYIYFLYAVGKSLFAVTNIEDIKLDEHCKIISTKTCYDLDIMKTGEILLGIGKGFDIIDQGGKVLRSVKFKTGNANSIQYYKRKIYVLVASSTSTKERWIYVYSLPDYKEETHWELPKFGYISQMAVSNDKVYVVDPDNKKVKIYSLTGEAKPDFDHSAFRNPIHLARCPPDGVLLSDWSAGIVYKIECSTDKIIWEFKVTNPRGVFCDRLGNSWVWAYKEMAFHLRSADGKFLK